MFLPLFFAACFYRFLVNEIGILQVISQYLSYNNGSRRRKRPWSAKTTTDSRGRLDQPRWVGQVVHRGPWYVSTIGTLIQSCR
jgi:hypothetical protein